MELTPQTFEKAEFVEVRRGGYNIDQVEAFLEETGTEFARMLLKFEKAEDRVAAAEARASESEGRVDKLKRAVEELRQKLAAAEAQSGGASAGQSSGGTLDDQVENVARALILAQEAGDQALKEAHDEARNIVESARAQSEREVAETNAKIEALVIEGKARADQEFAARREDALTAVVELESRRAVLTDIISRLDERVEGYREDMRSAANELLAVADNPSMLGQRSGGQPASNHDVEVISPSEVEVVSVDRTVEEPVDEADDEPEELLDLSLESTSVEADAAGDDDVVSDDSEEPIASELESDSGTAEEVGEPAPLVEAASDNASLVAETATIDDQDVDLDDVDLEEPTTTDNSNTDDGTGSEAGQGYLDLRDGTEESSEVSDGAWGPGSWAMIADEFEDGDDDDFEEPAAASQTRESLIAKLPSPSGAVHSASVDVATPSTSMEDPTEALDQVGLIRDRFLEELDQAVNADLDGDDEALAAFLEGSSDAKVRRFGWRR
ncbi:MAG: hypothetical protein KDB26_08640 [Microthrixaceae bacterium]|nr:hypothetical protein [Microthrixaceae bacterium]